ncbi:MAG: hypothetical protein JSU77_11290 [Fidelibacterota bacterium]|nr:MAG: hypothetical protein JSU77_11290 [Candidatus Neomarinimicrobiota bacterium]
MKTYFNDQITLNESIRYKVHALQILARKIIHDTNNYYGILQGYLSLLEMQLSDDEDLRKFLPPMNQALRSCVELNKRLAESYRPSQVMVTEVDLASITREVCATFSQEHDFAIEVIVSGKPEPILLNEPAIRALVGDLCSLARKTGTSPAKLELAPAGLEEAAITAMVLQSQPGHYLRLRTTISLADYGQEEDIVFFDPFAFEPDDSLGLMLALLYNTLQNHGGNLDITNHDKRLTLNIYLPGSQR